MIPMTQMTYRLWAWNQIRHQLAILFLMMSIGMLAQDTLMVKIPKAQMRRQRLDAVLGDSARTDSMSQSMTINIPSDKEIAATINSQMFVPDPKKAMWLAIVIPGGGQIYNRKYWKLPIIYGGFLGCIYALNWNNTMYRDYSQAYIDIMDDDPTTVSYENFIPKNYNINNNLNRVQDLFRRKKNYYRRYRDLSMFIMMGVYVVSIIDAYVDAELSSFDISKDLSMKVRPSIIYDKKTRTQQMMGISQSYGVECSISF